MCGREEKRTENKSQFTPDTSSSHGQSYCKAKPGSHPFGFIFSPTHRSVFEKEIPKVNRCVSFDSAMPGSKWKTANSPVFYQMKTWPTRSSNCMQKNDYKHSPTPKEPLQKWKYSRTSSSAPTFTSSNSCLAQHFHRVLFVKVNAEKFLRPKASVAGFPKFFQKLKNRYNNFMQTRFWWLFPFLSITRPNPSTLTIPSIRVNDELN